MNYHFITKIANKASESWFHLFLLNRIMSWAVPFNRPHRMRIERIGAGYAMVSLPFIKRNRNHVQSLHACALATLCEFTSGVAVMTLLTAEKYRIVLKSLQMDYLYRAKGEVVCAFRLDPEAFKNEQQPLLDKSAAILFETTAEVLDHQGNLICTGKATWQIKSWQVVQSK